MAVKLRDGKWKRTDCYYFVRVGLGIPAAIVEDMLTTR